MKQIFPSRARLAMSGCSSLLVMLCSFVLFTPFFASATTIILTSGSSWTVPSDWNSSNNTVEAVGGGGGGSSSWYGSGGGGGAYARISNVSLTPGASVSYSIGAGGSGNLIQVSSSGNVGNVASPNPDPAQAGSPGGDTWFINGSTLLAKGGAGGPGDFYNGGGAGGSAAVSVGSVRHSGGAGGSNPTVVCNGAGGGGAGGSSSDGSAGGNSSTVEGPGAAGGSGGGGSAGAGGNGGYGGCNSSTATAGSIGGAYGGGGGGGGFGNYTSQPGGGPGSRGAIIITYTPIPKPTCSVTISPNPMSYGSSATLTYSSSNATTFYINSVGYVGASGSISVAPSATTDYGGSVTGPGGAATCPASLTVNPPSSPTATIAASSTSIYVGQSTNILATFAAGPGDALTADNIDSPLGTGLGANTNPGTKSITFSPTSAGTYTFYARATTQYYTSWSTYASITVTVGTAPSCTLSVSPTSMPQGQSSTLSYSSVNATAFSVSGIGSLAPNTSGTITASPSQSTTYTGTASAGGVNSSCSATLSVSCTPSTTYTCNDPQTLVTTSVDASCNQTVTQTACVSPQFCSAGSPQCLTPQPTFVPFGNFDGHLHIKPTLIGKGSGVYVYWNVTNVQSCSVTGTNGDSWSGTSSGSGGERSGAINDLTAYTLTCVPYSGATFVPENQIVNIVPGFQEK